SFYEKNGYASESSRLLIMIGRYHRDHREYDAALSSFTKALGIAQRANDRTGIVLGNSSLGSLLSAHERYPEALDYYRKNAAIAIDPDDKAFAALQVGAILWQLGRAAEAAQSFALADEQASKNVTLRLRLLRSRAELALSQSQATNAASLA